MKNINVIKQVAILPEMTTDELKQMWKKYHKTTPPPFNRVFLIKRLMMVVSPVETWNVQL